MHDKMLEVPDCPALAFPVPWPMSLPKFFQRAVYSLSSQDLQVSLQLEALRATKAGDH